MNAWVKFIDKVPSQSSNFGFKIQGNVINDWVKDVQPNIWAKISCVGKAQPDQDSNHVLFIFDTVEGHQKVRLSQLELELFGEEPEKKYLNGELDGTYRAQLENGEQSSEFKV